MPDENEAANYDKVVIPKDEETRRALEAAMCKNILFSHLEVRLFFISFTSMSPPMGSIFALWRSRLGSRGPFLPPFSYDLLE